MVKKIDALNARRYKAIRSLATMPESELDALTAIADLPINCTEQEFDAAIDRLIEVMGNK